MAPYSTKQLSTNGSPDQIPYLGAAVPCQFTNLEGGTFGNNGGVSAYVELEHNEHLQSFLAGDTETMASVLKLAWGLVLRCYTGQDDVCFAYQELGDAKAALRMLLARVAFDQAMTIQKIAQNIQNVKQEHMQDNYSEDLVHMCNTAVLVRDCKGSKPCTLSPHLLAQALEHFSLLLDFQTSSNGPKLYLHYRTDRASAEQAQNIASTVHTVLGEIKRIPNGYIGNINYVSQSNIEQLWEWNSNTLDTVESCIHDVIRDQAVARPHAEAVCDKDGSLSYYDLDKISSRLAKYLTKLHIGPGKFVLLCLDKSIWNVVSMLAVLKTGAAFVPLDPAAPIERLQTLSASIGSSLVICSQQYAHLLSTVLENVMPIDGETIGQLSDSQLVSRLPKIQNTDIAYMIFTSGTTGMPKATMIEHRAFCSSAKAHAKSQLMDSETRALQFAAHTFDASLVEILTTLMVGGVVCIPSEDERLNTITEAMNAMKVNWAVLTPSFVGFIDPVDVPGLKTLVLAGEAMSESHVATWSKINLVNGYGPSECSVCAVANSSVTAGTSPTNIGKPVGVHAWIVDRYNHDTLVPIGCVGELLLQGPSLARGYHNDPDKTAVSFVTAPPWAKNQRWLCYKTGDLVRQCIDGSFVFVGRKDTQVKVHGQRVELGEIEAHLDADEDVNHTLVLLPRSGKLNGRLITVLSLSNCAAVAGDRLLKLTTRHTTRMQTVRGRLQCRLPVHMVPTTWLVVEAIPLLPSGKLDRKRVSTWVDNIDDDSYRQVVGMAESTEPSGVLMTRAATEVETNLRQIWSHVLNVDMDQVGLDSKFTALGGDSISAMLVKGQCLKKDINLTVQDILRSTSITQLAQCAKAVDHPSYHEELMEYNFDLSPIQQMFFKLPNQGKTHFNQSFFLRVARKIQKDHLRTAIETLVKRHSMLRARFSYSDADNKWQQRLTENVSGSYRLRTYKVDDPKSAEPAIADSQKSLDIINGPLFAADLFDVDGGEQLLFMVANHLAIDLVSWRVILEEIEELLLDPELASIQTVNSPLSFQTWCQIQAEHSQNLKLDKVLPIEVPSGEEFYWEMPEGSNTYGNVISEGFEVDAATTAKMLTQCHDTLRTEPIDVLLASLIHSFAQTFDDRTTPAIYNEGHGRDAENIPVDLSRTVGWFTIMYPVHVQQSAVGDTIALVREVKDLRRRVPDNGRQYFASRNLTAQGHSRFSHHWPLEISFNYLGQYQQLERKDSLLRPVEAMGGEARGAGGIADVGKDTPRFGLFEISAVIIQGKLRFSFTFNRHMKQQRKIRQWISSCQQTVGTIAETLIRAEPQATLGDFPLLSISNDGLQAMVMERLPSIGIFKIDDVEEIYPCSAIQDGLLISQNRNSAFYAIHAGYELKVLGNAPVDSNRLVQAWQLVVDRHPALRTVFIESVSEGHGLYDQVVLKHVAAHISIVHCRTANDALRVLSERDPVSYLNTNQPPHRFTVCEVPDERVFCKLDISHAIVDGTSMSILFQELAAAYEGLLPENIGTPYSRYITYLERLPRDMSIAYWTEYLSRIEPCIFPVLNDGQSVAKELHTKRLQFKRSRFMELQAFCQNSGVTLSNVFHTAWALTLRCFTGSDDPCFGYLASGRDAPVDGLENAVGVFINMLVCRVGITPMGRLAAITDQVQKDYLESLPHSETSLAEVQHALKLGGNDLFNTALSYRKLPKEPTTHPNVSFSECIPIYDPTEYSVSLNIEASDDSVFIDLDYWTDHISDEQANNVGSTFLKCLDNIVTSSDHMVGDLDFVSSENWDQMKKWNNQMPATIDDCLHMIIGRKSEEQPHSIAISAWDGEFTYAELDRLATRLALHLVAIGVVPGTFIPTCFDKSAWAVVAMLAVLKAGACAVPLDATYPASAMELRLQESKANTVLVSPQRSEIFASIGIHTVIVDNESLEAMPYGELRSSVGPGDPCFVIFTSGSTGKPKGVVLEHRAICSSAHATGTVYEWGSHSRVLQFASYTFDNSLAEIFITLTRGGCVCVPSEHERFNALAETINRLRVNFMDITPTVATFLRPSDVPTVKALSLGGEPLTRENIDTWGKAVSLHCCYGPSECSINSVWNGDLCKSTEATNIGKAIGSVSWIVDPSNHNRLSPIGSVGELLIEGPILARGYLNDAEKTAKNFIEQPAWAPGSGRRMYKTGDLVRYNSDGSITYLGRKDTQVKLNGQRLELGEIEHHVKQNLPSDAQSGVELISFGPRGNATKAIAAFFSLQSDSVPTAGQDGLLLDMSQSVRSMSIDLQAAISNAVPAYMVPSMFIPVKALPMTSSGKLDRQYLRNIVSLLSEDQVAMYRLSGNSGRALSTEMEHIISQLWGSVLNINPKSISAEDNFFGRGGDSIGAMKLITAARGKGISLTVSNVFQKPTLSDIAIEATIIPGASISNIQSTVQPFSMLRTDDISQLILEVSAKCSVEIDSIEDIYPCTALQEGLISLSNKDPGAYVAQNVYRLPLSVNLDMFRAAWQRVAEAEVILRTRVVYTEFSGFFQVVVREPIIWHQADRVVDLGEEDRQLPARNGDLLSRYTLINEAGSDPHFVWTAHHALYDGWSIPIMLERVEACYYDMKSVDSMIIPAYSQFIKYHSGLDKDSSDEFWKSRLSEPISTHFPSLPSPAYEVHATSMVSSTVNVAQPNTRITLPTTIRAAWALVIAVYSGNPKEVVFGEILSGRDAPVAGIEDLVGPTLATVPTRIHLDPSHSVIKFLEDLQGYLAEAIPYQFAGIQNIKQLSEDAAIACGFQNLLAINHDSQTPESGFWNLQSSGTVGTNFMSYPLTVSCQITGSKVELEATYDHHVLSTWQVENMLRQFDFVLGLLNSPDIRQSKLGQIKLLNPWDEKNISRWNSEPAYPVNECIHTLIVRQVLSRPESTVAIDAWDATLSYQQLDDDSTRLAIYLLKQDIKGTFVPLFFEKSAWTIVAMLGILKCGAAFVPLDIMAPVARLQDIVQDIQPKVALCSSRLHTQCSALVGRSIGVDREMLERLPHEGKELPPDDHNSVAYLIYTSGSTGKPKGTIINHSAFCAGALSHGVAQQMDFTSRVLQFASYTFDASLLEILTTLIVGGTICVPSEESRVNTLAKVINDMSISWALLTPSVTQLLQPSQVPTLRTLVLGGEAMSQSHISKWADKVRLINAYGPSECSVVATVNSHMSMSTEPNNMGRAVGSRAWVTDMTNWNRLAPIGSIGELVIDGPTISQGYLNNEAKTAESFIQSPKWASMVAAKGTSAVRRMYRTGDLVKYTPDGNLLFCGRRDTQAKLHGQRLELGDVEHHLRMDASVQHALAIIPKSGYCRSRLVAILSLQETVGVNSSIAELNLVAPETSAFHRNAIRERLCDHLPSYMIPSNWVVLEKLPLLPSGKLDARKLQGWVEEMSPEMYQQVSDIENRNENEGEEGTEIERRLQNIWAGALNLPPSKIGLNTSFYHLGGDSITAMQVMSKCRAENLGVTVRDIIRSKSLSQLALLVTLPEVEESNKDEEFETLFDLSPIQKLYFDCVGSKWAHFNQSVMVRLARRIEIKELTLAIELIILSHSMLRARFSKNGAGEWQQRIMRDASNAYRLAATSTTADNVASVVEASQKGLDIQNGPTFAVDLFEIENECGQLLSLVAHHLVIDVVSWRVILQDLEDVLDSGALKLQSSLPFQTWCHLQAEDATQTISTTHYPLENVPTADFAYWDMVGKSNVHGDTIEAGFEIDSETSSTLLGPCHDSLQTEPVDVFLAASLQSFRRVFPDRSSTPAIYNEGHGREPWDDRKVDLSRTVGWFTTMCPIFLPSNIEGDTDLMSTIRWTKDLRSHIPAKGRPYFAHRLLTEDGRQRFAGHWPMEITFNYLGRLQQLEREDALLQPVEGATNADFDVSPDVPRFALIEISAAVTNGAIKISVSYNRHMKRQAKIRRWIVEFKRFLQDATKQLMQSTPERTLSHFPLLPLEYNGLANLTEKCASLGISSLYEIEDVYPCAPTQRGILLAQLRDPNLYAYSAVFEVCPSQPGLAIDTRLLSDAWQAVVRRHATLRTVFIDSICQSGLTGQVVLKDKIARVSWLVCEDSDVLSTLNGQTPLNFHDFEPPHRLTICTTSNSRVFCKLEMSHTISDGTSVPILLRDIASAYKDNSLSGFASLNSTRSDGGLAVNDTNMHAIGPLYSDYIAHIQSTSFDLHINYWKAYLDGIEPCHLNSLNDGMREKELQSLVLNITHEHQLRNFCTHNGVSISNVLQLVWAIVLRCYTGSDEVCFGYLTSGRDAPIRGIQDDAVGAFVNMIICRINLTDSFLLSQALEKIQTDFINSMAHQSCSLADVQHELGLSSTSLFNTAFTFQNRSNTSPSNDSPFTFDVVDAHDPSEYDVTVNIEAFDSRLEVHFGYWTSALSPPQASNIAATFEHIVDIIISNQHDNESTTIADLDLFSSHSRQQVLQWNRELPLKVENCIHDMVRQHAIARPRKTPAICAWDVELSYYELDSLATHLAKYLVEQGIGKTTYVPLCFDKSGWAVVSMIAVMKAGGTIVPLDHTHPEGRLQQFISDVDATLVLCSQKNEEKIASISKAIVINRQTMDRLSKPSKDTVLPTIASDHSAYIIFTSGTTGRPKGTIIEHGAFCTSAVEHSKAMFMRPDSRVFQFASYTFDASIMEILSTLIVGGCVCVPSEQDRFNDIPGAINRMGVTWTLLTPAVAGTLSPESVPGLKVLVTGGEAMSSGHISKWKGKTTLINAYGPSETSVIATTSTKVDETGNEVNADPSNIGLAVGGRTWVVDPRNYNKLVPIGGIGELVVEGRTVARGYLNNEQKTSEVFIDNPTWLNDFEEKERVYRTGDIVRYSSNGTLNFVARKDTQIKLNGQRIELGEIEHHVANILPVCFQSCVDLVSPTNRAASKALAVFFATSSINSTSDTEDRRVTGADDILLMMSDTARSEAKNLDSSLAAVLPTYMIPSIYIPITKMPWTSSGKLDRARLRNIVNLLPKKVVAAYRLVGSENKATTLPTSPTEKKLQKLWETVLSVSQQGSVGREDNFFRLGGDSISAMRLVGAAKIEGIAISVIDIFRNPRLCDMALACGVVEEEAESELGPFSLLKGEDSIEKIMDELVEQCCLEKEKIQDAFPTSRLQQGLLTLSTKSAGAYIAKNAFLLPADLDLDRFRNAWQTVISDVEILRTRIVHMKSSTFIQVVIRDEPIPWNSAPNLQAVLDAPTQLPRHNGGLLTEYTITDPLDSGERYFVWSLHHALYDGWSLPMVLKKVEAVYKDGAVSFSKTPYSLFIKWLSEIDEQVSDEFWRKRLSGSSPLVFPQGQHTVSGDSQNDETLCHTASISRKSANTGITMPTIIRAAWALIVASYSGSNDVIFGETLAGRDIPVQGITDMIGPTITTIPTRIQVEQYLKVTQFLEGIQRMATDVIPYQHAGLSRIKRLNPDSERACDFQNLLVIQNAEEEIIESGMWKVHDTGSMDNFFTYPLVLECKAGLGQVHITAYYDTNSISTWEVQRIMYQLDHVLKQLTDLPKSGTSGTLSDIQVFSPQDSALLREWNPAHPQIMESCIHEEFEEIVECQPDAPAVSAWDGDFTYGDIKTHAIHLAQHLVSLGVQPEQFVPICMDKSAWAVVAMLGVFMAGGAYLPLDPSAPISRHKDMFLDVNPSIILCSPRYSESYKGIVATILPISGDMIKNLPKRSSVHELHRVHSRNAAYVIFTSGSSGRPKGTVIEHRSISTSCVAMRRSLLMQPTSRVFQFASFAFDVSILEIFATLTYGGCVCIPSEDMRTRDVSEAIRSLNATWAFLTPSVANLVDPPNVPSLEVLVCGGEAMSIDNVSRWADKVTLVNGYGPTEASVISVANSEVSSQKDPSNIGRALPSGLTWIADPDDYNRITPVGCVGELLLDGPLLAREYINNPTKTDEAFVKQPAWTHMFEHLQIRIPNQSPSFHSTKMYRTGDLVKYSQDGSLIFIGRKDNQVKLHGQRMEPGEIEHALDQDSQVRRALVVLPKSGPFRKRLVAIVSLETLSSTTLAKDTCELILDGPDAATAHTQVASVRDRLSLTLPPYMIPSSWLVVQSIPILSSGKPDRRQVEHWLESIDDQTYQRIIDAEDEVDKAMPTTETGELLQDIFSHVLNLPISQVKLTQSFLALGGDSISAMQVMALCRKAKINFSLSEVLKSTSIHQLASIARHEDAVQHQEAIFDQDFDLSPIQQLYFQSQKASRYVGEARFNQSFSLVITRHVESQDIESAIQLIVDQHTMLRARFRKNPAGVWKQRLTAGTQSSYLYRNHQVDDESHIPELVAESQSSLDIEKGPLFVVDLVNISGKPQMIFLAAHHLIIDMVSWRIILADLEEILKSGTLSSLPSLSFQVWCNLQAERSLKEASSNQVISLPSTIATPNMSFWGMDSRENTYQDVVRDAFTINKTLTDLAMTQSHRALKTEPLDIFISAVVHSFSRVFVDRATPAVFNESHGREPWDSSIDLSRTVGWFTTIAPIHADVDLEEDDVVDTVRRIKDNRRKLLENGRPYFAHQYLTPDGRNQLQGRSSTMEIIFNYLGRMQQLEHSDALLQQWTYPEDESTTKQISDVGDNATRLALFEVSAAIVEDEIQFSFLYNKQMCHQSDIKRWVSECQETLEEMVQRLSSPALEPAFTLSDFPLLPISYDGLEKIVNNSLPQVGISPEQVEDIFPTAPLQEGLLLSQLKDQSLYHFHAIMEVHPAEDLVPIDAQRLAKCWQRVVDYHTSLRTVFADSVYKGDSFNQIVVKKADSGVFVLQCDGGEKEAVQTLLPLSILDFNYTKQPRLPHQAIICETSSGKVYMKTEVNHAVIDGASANIMLRDLAGAYHGTLTEEFGPLYSEYVAYIKRQPASAGLAFWRSYLEGARICLFPSLSGQPTKEKKIKAYSLEFDQFSDLQDMCKNMKVTFATAIQAAWAFCLRLYTNSDDVSFGYLTSGRDVPVKGIQDTMGAFINMLVCRVKFSNESTLKEVFDKVQNDFIDFLDYQHCSLARVQHEITGGRALFNTAMSVQGDDVSDRLESTSINFTPVVAHDPSEYAVTINARTAKGDEGIVIRYWTDTLSEEDVNGVADVLIKIMRTFIDKPNLLVGELNLEEANNPPAIDPAIDPPPTLTTQPQPSAFELRTMVNECVREVIEQLFKSGSLVSYDSQRVQNTVNRVSVEAVEATHPMIDYSQTTNVPMVEEIKQPARTIECDPKEPGQWDDVEQRLLQVWSELLQISPDSIRTEDHFFELGGDSIIAMQMVGAARDIDLALTVATIFHYPTFADMAAVLRVNASQLDQTPGNAWEDNEAREARSQAIQNAMYQRYSLLEAANVDAFLQENICPKVRAFRGGIVDVFPVTDFQALAVTGTLMSSKWMLNYFHLEGEGALDLRKLKDVISQVVESFDILRTVFVPYGNRFFQVVLRKLQPSFTTHDTDDLAEFTNSLQEKDREHGPRPGESYLQFVVAKKKGSDKHRIIMRLSHAQYDGVCLPKILAALQAGFRGSEIASPPPFSTYVRDSVRTTTDSHYLYWKDLMKGSSMTEVVQRRGPNYNRGNAAPVTFKKIVKFNSLASQRITPATVIKAAWSLVLGQFAGSSDIVFGNVISGRNAAVVGVESIIGPCVNLIPVRVTFKDGWSIMDLLKHIQDQQVANMPYESLGFREIIKHCTDWPDWMNFSTVCQHQNIQSQTGMELAGNEYTLGTIGSQEDLADITILSTPKGDDSIEICLVFTSNTGMTFTLAEQLFESLCEVAITFTTDSMAPLPKPSVLTALLNRTLRQDIATMNPAYRENLNNLSHEEVAKYSAFLRGAWAQILWNKDTPPPSITLESSFYDLGGDIIGLAQLSSLLDGEGYQMRVEELVDCPVFGEQVALVASIAKNNRDIIENELREMRAPAIEAEIKKKGGFGKALGKSVGGLKHSIRKLRKA